MANYFKLLKILLIEPFYTDSHKQWADGLIANSRHQIKLLSLPGRHWKWRMFGAAVTLANEFKKLNETFDLILATDMLDVSTFLGLTKELTANTKTAIYFHENQLTYPWSKNDPDVELQRDRTYAFINYTSALAADKVLFNSAYHKNSFLNALPDYLKAFPDFQNINSIESITEKSEVLHVGLNLQKFDAYDEVNNNRSNLNEYPLILWNHRWEFDKNPEQFFNVLQSLQQNEVKFKLVVLGKAYSKQPNIFNEVTSIFKDELLHIGYAESFEEYAKWLQQADIIPITSNQEFFGISLIEAMYCNTFPLLPKRLSYPEHIPANLHNTFFYDDEKHLKSKLQRLIFDIALPRKQNIRNHIKHYNWQNMVTSYDNCFELIK